MLRAIHLFECIKNKYIYVTVHFSFRRIINENIIAEIFNRSLIIDIFDLDTAKQLLINLDVGTCIP